MSRCLYNSSFENFINADENSIFGEFCDNYHGDALTTTREAWRSEISPGRVSSVHQGLGKGPKDQRHHYHEGL